MVELIKSTLRHPLVSWLGGVSLWAVLTFCFALGSYKEKIDVMSKDVTIVKTDVVWMKSDIKLIKYKVGLPFSE